MTRRRLAAFVALVVGPLTVALAVLVAVDALPRGLAVIGGVVLGLGSAWYGLRRRGLARALGLGAAVVLLVVALVLMVIDHSILDVVLVVVGLGITLGAAEVAFAGHVPLPPAARPRRPVLVYNPRSGGGKAARFALADEARARGIEPIELKPGLDLEALVREAVEGGADGLAMAGGDGSQAIVAAIAAERGLPYACVPAGTRNHFALDLGVDRDDVVGALDAFVDGGERVVDLAEVNGRVFVNNVSLGVYAEAVQRPGYREAKLRTLLDTVPDVLGDAGEARDMSWRGPDGDEHHAVAVILVSNNRYRLGRATGSGTRPRMDTGGLGIAVVTAPSEREEGTRPRRPWLDWSAPAFEVASDRPVPAGIDGEAVMLEPPLRFGVRARVLRVRVARQHPGASPSAMQPEGMWEAVRALLRIAAGRPDSIGRSA